MNFKDIPAFDIPADARDHMRTHVYVNVSVTERNPDDYGYRRVGCRKWVTREEWYSATDAERESAIQSVAESVAAKGTEEMK